MRIVNVILLTLAQHVLALPTDPRDESETQRTDDRLSVLPAEVIWEAFAFLTPEDIQKNLKASPQTIIDMEDDFNYCMEKSTMGSEGAYITIDNMKLPPSNIDLAHLYVCDNVLSVIESSGRFLKKLLTLHVKMCADRYLGDTNKIVIDKFLNLAMTYSDVSELRVFGPSGQPLSFHLYDYLVAHPLDQSMLENVVETGLYHINERYARRSATHLMHTNWTILHDAAINGDDNLVQQLIGYRANVSAQDDLGWTPLYSAAKNSHIGTCQSLIDAGADLNTKEKAGFTPLHVAALNGRLDLVNLLLDRGADANPKHNHESTPLMLAILEGHAKVAESLLEHGADANLSNSQGSTPLILAAENACVEMLGMLVAHGAEIDLSNSSGWTPIHFAAKTGDVLTVDTLIGLGANMNLGNNDGITPLHVAALNGRDTVVDLLLGKGVDPETRDHHGRTPLYFAQLSERGSVIRRFRRPRIEIQKQQQQAVPIATDSNCCSIMK